MKYDNRFEYKVYGDYALFSDPVTRVGGEKSTLPVPTYAALIGVTKSIYAKPTFRYYIDEVKILNPIRTVSKGVRRGKYQPDSKGLNPELSMYTYLFDVAYAVRGHFVWNENHPELEQDRNEDKHFQILKRMIARGGRRDVFLGTRECQAYVEPCCFDREQSFYSDGEISLGLMYHSIIYADEAICDEDKGKLTVCFHTPVMRNGIIHFDPPEIIPPENKRHIKSASIKVFDKKNFTSVNELFEEVSQIELDE